MTLGIRAPVAPLYPLEEKAPSYFAAATRLLFRAKVSEELDQFLTFLSRDQRFVE
jgi:hypothetical protein